MLSKSSKPYQRTQAKELRRRLAEPRRFIQAVAGPRQVGKTTLVQQLAEGTGPALRYASADEPTLRGAEWIAQQWEAARLAATESGKAGVVLALDEFLARPVSHWVRARADSPSPSSKKLPSPSRLRCFGSCQ